jgi:hypothetical protein
MPRQRPIEVVLYAHFHRVEIHLLGQTIPFSLRTKSFVGEDHVIDHTCNLILNGRCFIFFLQIDFQEQLYTHDWRWSI